MRSALIRHHLSDGLASTLSLITVTAVISFFSLVLQELAPKRLALQRPESLALVAAPILDRISVLARPLVWLLSKSTNLVVRVLGGDPSAGREVMTAEELQDLVVGHQALSADEREIVADVFDAGKRQLREVLLPRTEVEFIAADTPLARAAEIAAKAPHSRFPVYQESYDDVIGFVHVRDLLNPGLAGKDMRVGDVTRQVERLPISKRVLPALSEMRRNRSHLAIVIDEYGGTAGIVTLEDLVEELVGDIRDEYDTEEGSPRQLPSGQVEVDGLLNLDEFAEQTGVDLPEGPYETVAGYVLAALGRLPSVGDSVEVAGRRITVTEMDARRIARVRVGPASADPPAGHAGTATEEAGRATSPAPGQHVPPG
jgi:putative hemolysin